MTEQSDQEAVNAAVGKESGTRTPRWVWVLGVVGGVIVLLIVVFMLLPGRGGHGPGRHGIGDGASSQDVGEPAHSAEATRPIEILAGGEMSFDPPTIEVSPGEVVRFVVTNSGEVPHDFTIGDESMQAEHAEAMGHKPGGMPHDLPNAISLQPGETKELTWRFGTTGMLEYGCHVPGHYEAGMRGQIRVQG